MRYFLDTEFIETQNRVDLVSVAVVAGGEPPWGGDDGAAQRDLGVRHACALASSFDREVAWTGRPTAADRSDVGRAPLQL